MSVHHQLEAFSLFARYSRLSNSVMDSIATLSVPAGASDVPASMSAIRTSVGETCDGFEALSEGLFRLDRIIFSVVSNHFAREKIFSTILAGSLPQLQPQSSGVFIAGETSS